MLIRLEDRTPPYYTEESRDFQLFLRLYDCINNMMILDSNEVSNITDTRTIKTELLPLLQTKVGFFTNYNIDAEMMRTILYAFPIIVKNKGTIEGIKQAVRIFLKVLHIETEVDIFYTSGGVSVGNLEVSDHSLLIGIGEVVDQFYVLEEIFRYILPAGFSYTIYFYEGMQKVVNLRDVQEVYHLTVGQDINSSVRYKITPESLPVFSEDSTYIANILIRKEAGDTTIYRSTQPIVTPGECTFDNWGEYWESFDPHQDKNYNYGENIRNILMNSTDTIVIYDSRAETGTNGTEYSDIGGGIDG